MSYTMLEYCNLYNQWGWQCCMYMLIKSLCILVGKSCRWVLALWLNIYRSMGLLCCMKCMLSEWHWLSWCKILVDRMYINFDYYIGNSLESICCNFCIGNMLILCTNGNQHYIKCNMFHSCSWLVYNLTCDMYSLVHNKYLDDDNQYRINTLRKMMP